MKSKKAVSLVVGLFVILLLVVPIPLKSSADGSIKAYQALTYKIITTHHGDSRETKTFFFPNNFKSAEELLSKGDISEDGGDGSTGSGKGQSSAEIGGGGGQISQDIEERLDELMELTEGELDIMQIVPKDGFSGKMFSCGFDGSESVPVAIIRDTDGLNNFISGPKSKITGSDGKNKSGAFLKYAQTLDEDFFKNRALLVRCYYTKNGSTPTIESVAKLDDTIIVGVSLKKPKDGETDLRGCILIVDIDKQYLSKTKSCKFMMMPVIQNIGKVPLGGK